MKSVQEIKEISKTYSSGPIVKVALEDAFKWIEAYRDVAYELSKEYDDELQEDIETIDVDSKAARIMENK